MNDYEVLTDDEASLVEIVRECVGHYLETPGNQATYVETINADLSGMLAIVDRLVSLLTHHQEEEPQR